MRRPIPWLLAAGMIAGPLAAAAQQVEVPDVPRNVTVAERFRPELDPLGMRAGGFLIYPRVSVLTVYDSNVFARSHDVQDDIALEVSPRILVRSQWSRHALSFSAGADAAFFADESGNNYVDADAGLRGRLDVTRRSAFTGSLKIARRHEGREDPDDVGAKDVTIFYDGDLSLGYRHQFGRFFVQPRLRFRRRDFQDEGGVNHDDRDRNAYIGQLRAGMSVSPRVNAFVQGRYNIIRYDETPNDQGLDRDSDGWFVGGGVELDFTGLLFGEISVGYARRDYDDPNLDDPAGFSGMLEVTWNPTRLTSVIFTGEAGIAETTVNFDGEDATARMFNTIGVEVIHELRRNILLRGRASFEREDFKGTDRSDNTFRAGLGLGYIVNRWLVVDAGYDFAARDSDEADRDYLRHVVRVGVTLRR